MKNKSDFISKLQNSIVSYASNQDPNSLVEDIINQSFDILTSYVFDRDQLIIGIGDKGLFVNDEFFTREEGEKAFIKSFSNNLNESKICRIYFFKGISLREYILFISLMTRSSDFLKDHKQVQAYLKLKYIKNIKVSFLEGIEEEFEQIPKKSKAVIVSDDIDDNFDQDNIASQEVFEAGEHTKIRTIRPAPSESKTRTDSKFLNKFESILSHIRKNDLKPEQKHDIIKNMLTSLSPEALLELINGYYDKDPSRNKELIYPHIDYDKFMVLSSHIMMLINDEIRKEEGLADFDYCERLRDILKDISNEPHFIKNMKVQARYQVTDILIFNRKYQDKQIMNHLNIFKGKINVSNIVELLSNIEFELDILEHKDISKKIIKELLQNLDNSKDEKVQEGFKRILRGLLDIIFDHSFSAFKNMINVILQYIRNQKNLSPVYNFACEIFIYYSTMLIKGGYLFLLRDILQVLNLHRSTKSQRSAEQWYKARTTINTIGNGQALKDMIASFFWMDEKKRSELLLTLLLIKETAVRHLLALLSEAKEIKSRKSLISALVSLGKDSVPEIISELSKKQPWYYIRNLILILGKTRSIEAANYIKDYLNHEDKRVRKEAINALINLQDSSAVNYLVPFLSSEIEEDPYIIKKIISSFEHTASENISFLIIRILNDELYSHVETEEEDIKQACCYIAGKLRIQETVPMLRKIISRKSLFGINKSHSDSLRVAALYALYKIGTDQSEIKKYLKDDSPAVRSVASELIKS